MDNSTNSLFDDAYQNNNTALIVVSTLGAVLTLIAGFLAKLHLNRSSCSSGKCCNFDVSFDNEEIETLNNIRRTRRLSSMKKEIDQELKRFNERLDSLKEEVPNNDDEYIQIENNNNIYDKLNKENIVSI